MPYLSDRQRVELVLPPCVMMGVLLAGVDPADPDLERACDLLKAAAREPIDDLASNRQRRILERVRRLHKEVVDPFCSDGQEVSKVGLIVFFWIQALVETGYFIFAEGSAIDQAMALYIAAIEHKAEEPRVVASARKQARKLLARLQADGYYLGVDVQVAA